MTDTQIKQALIDSHANKPQSWLQCQRRLPRTDYEWSQFIKTYRAIGGR